MIDKSFLSGKSIPRKERLIFALDVTGFEEAKQLVGELGDAVEFYKVGLQLVMSGDYFKIISWLHAQKKRVFADVKIFDVPETVKLAIRQLKDSGVAFVTVHGNDDILAAAVSEKGGVKILAVTVLTSLDKNDLQDLGFSCDVGELVLSRATRALKLGCDGVISSGLEAERLRSSLGERFLIVAPGIRPFSNLAVRDDQKRTVTVQEAFLKGADYIVVGRPIKNAANRRAQAEEIQKEIAELFDK